MQSEKDWQRADDQLALGSHTTQGLGAHDAYDRGGGEVGVR
jgi:hypothetical protein